MVEVVVRSSIGLETQMKSQRELSKLERGTFQLNTKTFNVSVEPSSSWIAKRVIDMIKPMAAVKKLSLSLVLTPDLPSYAVGDQEKLMQIVLNVVGNAVKFTKEGCVSVTVSVAHPESHKDWRSFKLFLVSNEDHFYLKVQVEDFGRGIDPQEITKIFNRFKDPQVMSNRSTNSGFGLAISKQLPKLLGGRTWVESDGFRGCTAAFILNLGLLMNFSNMLEEVG
ncbi:hypothetical protein Cgig2_008714 [Carnegiea gigantea]|uniref:Histidine kinase domain-containing protein n=1 Tax=Carnegiea gigantea TaxID=171969 RepID=A0A9Q1GUC8_9CARY|nr:hypothetical protein Cgig2_008714 [Carnegiea gigantea]